MIAPVEKNVLRDLGFQSRESFVNALRVDSQVFEQVLADSRDKYLYETWREQKRSGNGSRLIENPHPPLKRIQRQINRILQRLDIPQSFQGCRWHTSIVTNAVPHCQNSSFLGLDLADYYETIRPKAVYDCLCELRMSPEVARLVTRLTTVRFHVPQGAPTSPMIAAIALLPLERRLAGLLKEVRGVLTVYGDNLSLSSDQVDLRRFEKSITRIIRSEGFRVREDKTVRRAPGQSKPLPGVLISGGKVTVRPEAYEAANRVVSRCIELGTNRLAAAVCSRLRPKLAGIVHHLAWIDREACKDLVFRFSEINWPSRHLPSVCRETKCACLNGYLDAPQPVIESNGFSSSLNMPDQNEIGNADVSLPEVGFEDSVVPFDCD